MTEKQLIVPGENEGFLSGCPFCASYRIRLPKIGVRFRIISGYRVGATGTVIEWPKNFTLIPNEFMAQMDNDPPEYQSRVSIKRELIQIIPSPTVPEWAPPLCLEDASELDLAIVQFCQKSFFNGKWKIDWDSFNEVIKTVWDRKLPLEPNEIWLVLRAHGVPENSRKILIDFYARGRNLLIYSAGKKSIKKKRVKPLSV